MKIQRGLSLLSLLLALGLTFSGCGGSNDDTIITGPFPFTPSAPVANPDAYTTAGSSALVVPAINGVLINDATNEVPGQPVTVTFQSSSVGGGTVSTTNNNDGSFAYTPAPGYLGLDSFEYELSNGFGLSRTTVTIDVTPQGPGYFVNSRTGDDATGDFQSGAPFATVQAAITAAGPGADIVILPGIDAYTGQVDLFSGQRLLGAESVAVNAQGLLRPSLTGPIILADGNTLDSLRVANTAGIAVDGDGQDSGTVSNCEVLNTQNGTGIQIRGVTGDWRIEDNQIKEIDGIGLDMDTQGSGTGRIRANRNVISDCSNFGLGMAAFGQSELAVQANNNTLLGNGQNLGPSQAALGYFCASAGTATITVELIGNTNNGIYGFAQTSLTSTINVERFAQITDLNEGVFVEIEGAVTDVPLGTAGF